MPFSAVSRLSMVLIDILLCLYRRKCWDITSCLLGTLS